MEIPQSIKHVFAPLGARLFMYEGRLYIEDFTEYDPEDIVDFMDIDFKEPFYKICREINAFDSNEVCQEAKLYENRIFNIVDQLEPRKYGYVMKKLRFKKVPLSEEAQEELMKKWKMELYFYLYHLQTIQSVRAIIIDKSVREKVLEESELHKKTVININNKPQIRLVKKQFTSQIPPSVLALFLHYLRKNEIVPPYSNESLGDLATYLFAGSDRIRQNLSKKQRDINEIKDLPALKEVLSPIIHQIEADIKKLKIQD